MLFHVNTLNQIKAFSLPFEPTCSIIQGLRSGTRIARIMTLYIMARICTANVRCSHRLWIDNLSQSTKGSRPEVIKNLTRCLVGTAKGLHQQKLKIASKSVITCSNYGDAKKIARTLKLKNIVMTASRSTMLLGADLGAGRRHVRAKRKMRNVKHLARHKKSEVHRHNQTRTSHKPA